MCTCGHVHTNAQRYDPSNTGLIRRRFEGQMKRRLRALARAVRKYIVEDDALDLLSVRKNAPFQYRTSADRINAFKGWLRRQQAKGLLEVQTGTSISSVSRAWSDVYIESAYQRGVAQSTGNLRAAGAKVSDQWVQTAFFRPIHADAVGLLYTRTFTDLEGVSDFMASRMSSILSQGMVDGAHPRQIAKEMADTINGVGLARARTIARSETMFAHAESTLNSYQEAGIEGVEVLSEFVTAGDNKVCPKCQDLDGEKFTIQEARGIIPVHPNCRCAWLPYIPEDLRGKVIG